MIEDTIVRMAAACQVQNFVDNPFRLLTDTVTDDEVNNLKRYLKTRNVKIPKFKDDKTRADIIKMMYLAWVSLECLDLMCELIGEEE